MQLPVSAENEVDGDQVAVASSQLKCGEEPSKKPSNYQHRVLQWPVWTLQSIHVGWQCMIACDGSLKGIMFPFLLHIVCVLT